MASCFLSSAHSFSEQFWSNMAQHTSRPDVWENLRRCSKDLFHFVQCEHAFLAQVVVTREENMRVHFRVI